MIDEKSRWAIRIKGAKTLDVTDFKCTYKDMVDILKKQGYSSDDVLSIIKFV